VIKILRERNKYYKDYIYEDNVFKPLMANLFTWHLPKPNPRDFNIPKGQRVKMKRQQYVESSIEADFVGYFSKTKRQIESELSKFVSNLSELDLYPQIAYAVLSEGKRFRPLLVILSAESVGGIQSKVMPLAIAFELVHTATLVHDDIIDQDEMRRGQPSLYKRWSINEAILTGDALTALSVSSASAYGETVLRNMAKCAIELCEGERVDLVSSLKTINEEVFFKKIRDKSASLCRTAAYCGAIAGGGTLAEARALSMFGENFGIAYQLRDDVLDFTEKGNLNLKDLSNGRVTLPLIYCYSTSTKEEKEEIEKLQTLINEKPLKANEKMNDMLQLIRSKGAFEYCEEKIDEYLSIALRSISTLKNTEYKAYLFEMARTLRSWAGTCENQI
jgi:geranylgeranyl pyrophosphate synthase